MEFLNIFLIFILIYALIALFFCLVLFLCFVMDKLSHTLEAYYFMENYITHKLEKRGKKDDL